MKHFRRQFSNHAGYSRLKSLSVRFLPVSIGTLSTNLSNLKQQHIEILEAQVEKPIVEEAEPENEIVTNPKVMLSTEIAALTGKLHKNVMRDIEVIIEKMHGSNLSFSAKSTSYTGENGNPYKCYELDYEATMIVMTGYDVVARAKVIKRWQELEKKTAPIEPPKPSKLIDVKQELSAAFIFDDKQDWHLSTITNRGIPALLNWINQLTDNVDGASTFSNLVSALLSARSTFSSTFSNLISGLISVSDTRATLDSACVFIFSDKRADTSDTLSDTFVVTQLLTM